MHFCIADIPKGTKLGWKETHVHKTEIPLHVILVFCGEITRGQTNVFHSNKTMTSKLLNHPNGFMRRSNPWDGADMRTSRSHGNIDLSTFETGK